MFDKNQNKNQNKNQTRNGKRAGFLMGVLCAVLLLSGCGSKMPVERVVFTTGFSHNEVFRINRTSCTVPEMMVYLTNTKNQYENAYGEGIWKKDMKGADLEKSIKENVLAKIAQIKAMNLLAQQQGITLDEQEEKLAAAGAKEYYDSLNETEREAMGADSDLILNLMREYALANKVYNNIIKDINPEISDDEARTITVEQIFLKTYTLNGKGEREEVSDAQKAQIRQTAEKAAALAKNGEDFSRLIETYSDDKVGIYSYGKGEMESAFEEATFNLGKDEISGVIESKNGYHIVKCISTFDREETDANKVKIVEQRKKEVFNQEYDVFLETLVRNLNTKLWDKITFIQDDAVKTSDFFNVYNRYFEKTEDR